MAKMEESGIESHIEIKKKELPLIDNSFLKFFLANFLQKHI